jgi:hypothetical protein
VFPEAKAPDHGWTWAGGTPGFRPQVLLAGSDSSGGTCIGVQLHAGPTSFTCAPELDRAVADLVADSPPARGTSHGMFLMGVSRADVTRVTVTTLGSTYLDAQHTTPLVRKTGGEVVYERGPAGWWGTFLKTTAQPRRWHAHVAFYGRPPCRRRRPLRTRRRARSRAR